jgi:hypothetical protein
MKRKGRYYSLLSLPLYNLFSLEAHGSIYHSYTVRSIQAGKISISLLTPAMVSGTRM